MDTREIEWLSSPRWISAMKASSDFPWVLLIDKDDRFVKQMANIARGHSIKLVTCKSAKDLPDLRSERFFDVIIIDFASEELGRKQVSRFVGKGVPVLIVGESTLSTELQNNFPDTSQKVLNKNVGARVILEEALAFAGIRRCLEDLGSDGAAKNNRIVISHLWQVLLLLLVATLIIVTSPRDPISNPSESIQPIKAYRWDRLLIPSQHRPV
ncbi:MAG: hypothetical protein HYZ71_06920 [Deltaproteobacteria bacterium]|nr:hypothetical protein [Deltaproteobacteria bacterium]